IRVVEAGHGAAAPVCRRRELVAERRRRDLRAAQPEDIVAVIAVAEARRARRPGPEDLIRGVVQEDRFVLRRTVARELRTERALWTEVELSSGGDEYTVVGNITRLIGRARRVARSHEVDARILVTVLPGDDARRFVARRGVDRDGDLSVGRDRLADKDAARGNRDTVHPGEQDIAGSQIVCLAVLVLVAEAEGAVRVPLDIHRGQDREGQRAGEGRRE